MCSFLATTHLLPTNINRLKSLNLAGKARVAFNQIRLLSRIGNRNYYCDLVASTASNPFVGRSSCCCRPFLIGRNNNITSHDLLLAAHQPFLRPFLFYNFSSSTSTNQQSLHLQSFTFSFPPTILLYLFHFVLFVPIPSLHSFDSTGSIHHALLIP